MNNEGCVQSSEEQVYLVQAVREEDSSGKIKYTRLAQIKIIIYIVFINPLKTPKCTPYNFPPQGSNVHSFTPVFNALL
jgi:hypothetical protein